MTTMEVVRIDTFGSREVMKFRQLPIPTPGPNEILLRVKDASINPVDWKIREGQYPAVKSDSCLTCWAATYQAWSRLVARKQTGTRRATKSKRC